MAEKQNNQQELNEEEIRARQKKIEHIFYIIIAIIVGLVFFTFSFCEESKIKTYVYEETTSYGDVFRGEFIIDFENETFTYKGHDIDSMAKYGTPAFAISDGIIEKSGYFTYENETRNNQKKYWPLGMDYYAWVNTDYTTLKYAGYTFTLK